MPTILVGFATALGLASAILALWLTGLPRRAKVVVPFSAGILLGVALFGLVPELGFEYGWAPTILLFGGGYGLLFLIDRFVYPVCPSCTSGHDHHACSTELHGFAAPLVSGASLHSFLDGWGIVAAQLAAPPGLRLAVPLAVLLHKIPEGVGLGGILRAATRSKQTALLWCILAEGTTLLGGLAGLVLVPMLGGSWVVYPMALAAGWLFFLGQHAVHEEWKTRGARPALGSAVAGVICAAVIEALLR